MHREERNQQEKKKKEFLLEAKYSSMKFKLFSSTDF